MIVYWRHQHQLELLKWHLREFNIVSQASGPCPAHITKTSPSFRCFHLSTLLSSSPSFSSHPEPPLLFKLLPEWVVDDMADFLLFGLQFLPQVDAEDKVSKSTWWPIALISRWSPALVLPPWSPGCRPCSATLTTLQTLTSSQNLSRSSSLSTHR